MPQSELAKTIDDAFDKRDGIGPTTKGPVRDAVDAALDLLDRGAAYCLWLERNIKNATVLSSEAADAPLNQFITQKLDALAGLRPGLLEDAQKVPGSKILPGNFMTVQQAIGTPKPNTAGAKFLQEFVADAKKSGLVASLIEKHHVAGLSVAP